MKSSWTSCAIASRSSSRAWWRQHRNHFDDMLDLGCGTGLAVQHLATFGGPVTGVDLSARMLAEAAKRGLYRALVKAEALAYLHEQPARHDLVFAADVLTYSGDLEPLFAAVARTLQAGGIFAANFETAEDAGRRPVVVGPLRPRARVGPPACRSGLHRPEPTKRTS